MNELSRVSGVNEADFRSSVAEFIGRIIPH